MTMTLKQFPKLKTTEVTGKFYKLISVWIITIFKFFYLSGTLLTKDKLLMLEPRRLSESPQRPLSCLPLQPPRLLPPTVSSASFARVFNQFIAFHVWRWSKIIFFINHGMLKMHWLLNIFSLIHNLIEVLNVNGSFIRGIYPDFIINCNCAIFSIIYNTTKLLPIHQNHNLT